MTNRLVKSLLTNNIFRARFIKNCAFPLHISYANLSSEFVSPKNDLATVVVSPSNKALSILEKVRRFIAEHVAPKQKEYLVRKGSFTFLVA